MKKINHIAIIMDGNGRWGKKRGKTRNFGHLKGISVIENIVRESIKLKIPILTFYTFSTENWKRPKKEINFLFNLIEHYFIKEIDNLVKNGVKINIIGNIKLLPQKIRLRLIESMRRTKKCKKILVNLAINYGSKDEILSALKKIRRKSKPISTKNLEKYLYTSGLPNPDILIRTGNTKRLSNFLLWQLAYTEIFFEKKLWPDFNKNDYCKILKKFKVTKRNYGNI